MSSSGRAAPLRALIVGLGSIGQRHARNLRALLGADVELLAYRARGLSHVIADGGATNPHESVSERLAITEYATLDEALARRPDIAFVCNPTRLHLAAAQRIAEADCHLFLEKPISDTLDGVDELARTVRDRGLITVVGCQLRFHPLLRRVHAVLREGALGGVTAARIACGEYLPGWHPYEDYRTTYAARRDLGGGVILTLIHELDYAYWLFGAPRSDHPAAAATIGSRIPPKPRRSKRSARCITPTLQTTPTLSPLALA